MRTSREFFSFTDVNFFTISTYGCENVSVRCVRVYLYVTVSIPHYILTEYIKKYMTLYLYILLKRGKNDEN